MNALLCQEQKLFYRRFKEYIFIKMYELSKWWVRIMIGTAFDIIRNICWVRWSNSCNLWNIWWLLCYNLRSTIWIRAI